MPKRRLRESVKKRIACSQQWKCVGEDCRMPDRTLPSTYQVDHVVPHALGGTDDVSNLRALCPTCHADKTQREHAWILLSKKIPNPDNQQLCITCKEVVSPHFEHDCPGTRDADYEAFRDLLDSYRYSG